MSKRARMTVWTLFLILSGASVAHGAPSYPLVCQGGSGMTALSGYAQGGLAEESIFISFAPGQRAHSPKPGECVWLDRGFRPSEPTTLRYATDSTHQVYRTTGSGTTAYSGPLSYLIRSIASSSTFYVQAYAWGSYLIVTRVGP